MFLNFFAKRTFRINNQHLKTTYRNLKYIPIETQNKIEIGSKMAQEIAKKEQKFELDKLKNRNYEPNPTSRLLIACSNKQFNHYTGQAYKNFNESNLASFGWRNRASRDQYFTINSLGSHPSLNILNPTVDKINELKINPILVDLLKKRFNISFLTNIQSMSINEILNRKDHLIILAETGGGKTLAYAIPTIEMCIQMNFILNKTKLERDSSSPLCIVLVPTRELVFQIYDVFKQLTNVPADIQLGDYKEYADCLRNLNIQIDIHESQIKAKRQKHPELKIDCIDDHHQSPNNSPLDILITMPGQLEHRLVANKKKFNSIYLKNFILDEADTLLDDGFNETTLKCLNLLELDLELKKFPDDILDDNHEANDDIKVLDQHESEILEQEPDVNTLSNQHQERLNYHYVLMEKKLIEPSTQLLLTSATIPRELKNILGNLVGENTHLKTISTNKINKIIFHVPQKFIRTNGVQRRDLLLEILRKELNHVSKKRTVMIFSHRIITAAFVHKFLIENNIPNELLIKTINNTQREHVVSKFFSGDVRILCCTDIASRGLDTLNVQHVINFEMPKFISDYLHRIGRVGRLKNGVRADGKVTNFVTNKHEVDLVWNIEKSVRLNCELENVNANVKQFYKKLYGDEFRQSSSKSNREKLNLFKKGVDEREENYENNDQKLKLFSKNAS